MAKEILYFELNTGARIPSVGLGTWQSEPGIIGQAVEAAIKIGYCHMDCSPYYHNEKEIGAVLKKLFNDGVAKRKTPAQIALRWGLQMGHSVLPKSVNESRIKENFDVFSWSIPDDLFSKFSDIEQARLVRGTFAVHETLSEYKTVEELWDGEI